MAHTHYTVSILIGTSLIHTIDCATYEGARALEGRVEKIARDQGVKALRARTHTSGTFSDEYISSGRIDDLIKVILRHHA